MRTIYALVYTVLFVATFASATFAQESLTYYVLSVKRTESTRKTTESKLEARSISERVEAFTLKTTFVSKTIAKGELVRQLNWINGRMATQDSSWGPIRFVNKLDQQSRLLTTEIETTSDKRLAVREDQVRLLARLISVGRNDSKDDKQAFISGLRTERLPGENTVKYLSTDVKRIIRAEYSQDKTVANTRLSERLIIGVAKDELTRYVRGVMKSQKK